MEIKDAISLYSFLGQLGLWGAIALSVILLTIITYLVVTIVEKITSDIIQRRKIVLSVLAILFISMSVLISNSLDSFSYNSDATAIKAYMISMKWKWLGYWKLAKEVHFPNKPALGNDTNRVNIERRVSFIKQVFSQFPNEFEITAVYDDIPEDSLGIELIDTSAIAALNKYNDLMLPYFKSELKNYMLTMHYDSLSYRNISLIVDPRLQSYLIDKLVASSTDLFTPVFADGDYYVKLNLGQ